MQKEQFKLSSRRSRTSSFSIFFFFFFGVDAFASPSDPPPDISSCRFLAFSASERDPSDSIARIAAIRSPATDGAAEERAAGSSPGGEQSGHSHWRVEERVSGGAERHCTCQGVAHVPQTSFSSSEGVDLQSMQRPSASQGRLLSCAMRRGCIGEIGRRGECGRENRGEWVFVERRRRGGGVLKMWD